VFLLVGLGFLFFELFFEPEGSERNVCGNEGGHYFREFPLFDSPYIDEGEDEGDKNGSVDCADDFDRHGNICHVFEWHGYKKEENGGAPFGKACRSEHLECRRLGL